MKTLLLWDIDGTLIDSGGAGERALRLALQREFAIEDSFAWLEYFGRTDLWIARSILEKHHGAATPARRATRRIADNQQDHVQLAAPHGRSCARPRMALT